MKLNDEVISTGVLWSGVASGSISGASEVRSDTVAAVQSESVLFL